MTRDQIIHQLGNTLKNNSFVYACWLEGADAHDRVDEYSDIDIWVDVEDRHESEIFHDIEATLSELGKIDFAHEIDHPHPKVRQKFFHLEELSRFLIIDICLQSHSRIFSYTEGFEYEKVKIIFDKTSVIRYQAMNQADFDLKLTIRRKELKKTFLFFHAWVEKSVHRGHFLEALGSYHEKVLKPLVEILRMRYQPTKNDFYLKDISQDLPAMLLTKLEDLYKIGSIDEITEKMQKAKELFFRTLDALEK